MKALVLRGDRLGMEAPATAPASRIWANPHLSREEVAPPQIATPRDVIVRVEFCGICGTDIHCTTSGPGGFVGFGGPLDLPRVIGHEFSGVVVARGDAVTHLEIGEAVTAESIAACWHCPDCRAGHLNDCQHVHLLGLTMHGALASLIRVDSHHCYSLEPVLRSVDRSSAMQIGTLFEPLGVALRGLKRATLRADDKLAVFGLGPIGFGAVMLAQQKRVEHIVAFDLNQERVDLARAQGVDAYLLGETSHRASELAYQALGGCRPSLVVEAAGTESGFAAAFEAMANRARLLVLGRMPNRVAFDTNQLLTKSLTVIGSRGHAGDSVFAELIASVADRTLRPLEMVTSRFPFDDWQKAFAQARTQSEMKILIDVGNGHA